jgi:uncharacterized membrane protein YeaQ/YmgE (transglycosylase-associated protein family)
MGGIAWIVLGAVAGVVAEHRTARETGRETSLLLATVVGIVGARLGG